MIFLRKRLKLVFKTIILYYNIVGFVGAPLNPAPGAVRPSPSYAPGEVIDGLTIWGPLGAEDTGANFLKVEKFAQFSRYSAETL